METCVIKESSLNLILNTIRTKISLVLCLFIYNYICLQFIVDAVMIKHNKKCHFFLDMLLCNYDTISANRRVLQRGKVTPTVRDLFRF